MSIWGELVSFGLVWKLKLLQSRVSKSLSFEGRLPWKGVFPRSFFSIHHLRLAFLKTSNVFYLRKFSIMGFLLLKLLFHRRPSAIKGHPVKAGITNLPLKLGQNQISNCLFSTCPGLWGWELSDIG